MERTRRGLAAAVAVGLALLLGGPGPADAQSTLEVVKKRGKLIAGVKTDFPPFGTIDASGRNVGFDVDVAHRFAQALFNDANQVELVAVTSGNRIPFLQSGKIDIIIATVTITDERRQVVEFSEPYFLSGSLLLVQGLDGPRARGHGGEDRRRGPGRHPGQGRRRAHAEGRPGQVRQGLGGRPGGQGRARRRLRARRHRHPEPRQGEPGPQGRRQALRAAPYGIAVRKGDTAFITWVNAELARMRRDGTYDRLWKKYFADVEANLVKP